MRRSSNFSPEEQLVALYGTTPPVQATGRLKAERILLPSKFYDDISLIRKLRHFAEEAGTDVSIGGNFGASFIAWLCGCTDVNPLPPHLRNPTSKETIFTYEGDGWDMPPLEPDGVRINWDGHEIPVESLRPRIKEPDSQLDIYLAESFAEEATTIIREHYGEEGYTLVPYKEPYPHFGDLSFVLLPKDAALPEVGTDGIWHTDLVELYAPKYRIIKMIFDKRKEQIRMYRRKYGCVPDIGDLLTESVMSAVDMKIKGLIQESDGTVPESDKLCFSTLLKEVGYHRSTHTDENPVYQHEKVLLSEVFTSREDVFALVQDAIQPEHRLSSEFAVYVAKSTRCGTFTRNRMDPETVQTLRGLGISEHWIEQMKHTGYLPAKAELIRDLLDELRLAWYEQQDSSVHHSHGRFMLYNGELRPSDSYLASHTLPGYSNDDWRNDAYDVNEDEEVLNMKRICQHCGREFTLQETARNYDSVMDWPNYTENYIGDLCAECAITEMKSRFSEHYTERPGIGM